MKIRNYLKDQLKQAGVSKILIERPHKKFRVTILFGTPQPSSSARRAPISEKLRRKISEMTSSEVHLNMVESASRRSMRPSFADIAQQLKHAWPSTTP